MRFRAEFLPEALWESFLRRYPNPKEAMQVRVVLTWSTLVNLMNSDPSEQRPPGAVYAAAANSAQLAREGLAAVPEAADASAAGNFRSFY